MPSPLPGMNPWIEQVGLWRDFHVAFAPALHRQLAQQVPPKYIVLMEEQIYIHELPPAPSRSIHSDLAVIRPEGGPAPPLAPEDAAWARPFLPEAP